MINVSYLSYEMVLTSYEDHMIIVLLYKDYNVEVANGMVLVIQAMSRDDNVITLLLYVDSIYSRCHFVI